MRRGRPRTEIGTYGDIKVRDVGGGKFVARTRFRARNGRLLDVTRRGPSQAAARRALKKALTELVDDAAGKEITGDTRMTRVMDLWLADLKEKVDLGKRAAKTFYDYRDTIDNSLRPAMGELTCREAEHAGLCNEVLKEIRRKAATAVGSKGGKRGKNGEAAMSRARTVLSGVCGLAVLHQAMTVNPVKSVERIERDKDEVRALEPQERSDFLTQFRAEVEKRVAGKNGAGTGPNRLGLRGRAWLDLPELVEAMLSTGLRIGEALALIDESVDLDADVVHASHHLVRVEGVGMVRKPKRKGDRPGLKVPIVSWTASMWRRRKLSAAPGGPVFASWNGEWLDPGNVAKRLNKICQEIGYGWVSSRYFRHTAATHLGDSDLTDSVISDALGNTPEVVRKHYRRPKVSDPRIAAAMETMLGERS